MCMKDGAPKKPAKGPCGETHQGGNYYYADTTANDAGTTDHTTYWTSATTTAFATPQYIRV